VIPGRLFRGWGLTASLVSRARPWVSLHDCDAVCVLVSMVPVPGMTITSVYAFGEFRCVGSGLLLYRREDLEKSVRF